MPRQPMGRQELFAKRKFLAAENRKWSETMTRVPPAAWPSTTGPNVLQIWRSNKYLATAYLDQQVVRLTVCRTQLDDQGDWLSGIGWDDLQRIKNECGFADFDAVEVYPAAKDVVDVANMRHLWILGEPCAFAWRAT